MSGKVGIVGHSPQCDILDLGHLFCIDTGAGFGGLHLAIELTSGEVWQVDESHTSLPACKGDDGR